MIRGIAATLVATSILVLPAPGKRVAVMAGSPEDKAIQQIGAEQDPAKRLPLIDKFGADFGSKPDMLTYAQQLYQDIYLETKEYDKSMEFGEKALAADTKDADVLLKLVRAAQEKPDSGRLFRYGGLFAELYNSLEGPPQAELKGDHQRLEYALFQTIARETGAKERLSMLDQFGKTFPKSQYATALNQYYAYTYQQLGDAAKMAEYAEKTLAQDPENVAMLLLAAQSFSEQGQNLERAMEMAAKALGVSEKMPRPADASPNWDKSRDASMGLAHAVIGYLHMRQNRNAQAITELKAAVPLVRSDPALLSTTLYRLGFAQAKNPKLLEEARATLSECSKLAGPFQQPAQELVARINARLAKP